MRSKFRIAMIPTQNAGVNYYRMASLAWEMRKHKNVEVAVFAFQYNMDLPHPWQKDFSWNPLVRRQIDSLCEIADVVIWQPVHYPETVDFFLEMRAKHCKPMLVETDDNYIDVPPWNEAFKSFAKGSPVRDISIRHMKLADGLIVSTPYLAEIYKPFNASIHVVPNSLNLKEWDKASVKRHDRLRLGWIGGKAHVNDLLMVAPVIKELLAKHKDLWFYVISSGLKGYAQYRQKPYVFEGERKVFYTDRYVTINLYPKFMASFGFDIGLAPLQDCHFNRAKSNLRWLEYSGLKIPTVASDISHFSQTITHGKDGMLCKENDLDEWKRNLELLIEAPDLRKQIGRNAYQTIKTQFNIRRTASQYLKYLRDFVGTGEAHEPERIGNDDRGSDQRSPARSLLYVAD